jgi:hypothetical protein
MKRKEQERRGLLALKHLRKNNLEQGHPFMINTPSLPLDQCYFEFPDGSIQIVTICRTGEDFEIVRELSVEEQSELRKTFQLV